jgi:hypothetical protein
MKLVRFILFVVVVFIIPFGVHAQATFGSSTDVQDLPIDGGISLLLAAGIGYGAKRLMANRNQVEKK